MSNIITIFADASLRDGKAGWAAWAKFRGETLRMSDGITFPMFNVNQAETIALACALLRAANHFNLPPYSIVVLQSDSTRALGALLWAGWEAGQNQRVRVAKNTDVYPSMPKHLWGIQADFARKAFQVIRERELTVYLKHVRAHTGNEDARSAINKWCDGEAKSQRAKVIHQSAERRAHPSLVG